MDRVDRLIAEAFPDATKVSVTHHKQGPQRGALSHAQKGAHMTTPQPVDDQSEAWEDEGQEDQGAYPVYPVKLNNHTFTWSPKLPDGSMLVIRAQSADALVTATRAIAQVANDLVSAWATVRPAPPAPQFQQQPNVAYQGQPGWQTTGAPQGQFQQAPQQPQGASLPPGWFKLNVPFKQKPMFDAIVAQNGFRKGDPTGGGQLSWQKERKSWYCSPDVAQAFAQFSPVPA
jgi:hypothetical protein